MTAHRRHRRRRLHRWMFAGLMAGSAGLLFLMSQGTHGEPSAVVPQVTSETPGRVVAKSPVSAGRYLVQVAGCNDCHTPGYAPTDGAVPESEWLTGVPIGWRGPWGTTYASNLRLFAQEFDEQTWVQVLKARKQRPPMPWASLRAMSDDDLRAIYHYLRAVPPIRNKIPHKEHSH